MFTAIAITLFWLLLCIVVLLAVPVEIIFTIEYDEGRRNEFAVGWLFGLLRIPVKTRSSKQSPEKVEKKTRRRGWRKVLTLVRNVYFRKRLFRYIRGLVRSIEIKTLDAQARIGLDDPADTGRLWGVLGPLISLIPKIPKANIRIEPEFAAEVLALQCHGRISVIPLQILSLSMRFFLSPHVIRALVSKS